ncbi:MAG: hypothetical protein IIX02_00685 [Clostridia bacterium]|nr:hypothetical protein [Clostridia bacterium]
MSKRFCIVAYAEEGLPRQEIEVIAAGKDDAWNKAWRFFPEYHEVGVFEMEEKN